MPGKAGPDGAGLALRYLKEFLESIESRTGEVDRLLTTGKIDEALTQFGDLLWELNTFLYLRVNDLEVNRISRYHSVWSGLASRILDLAVDEDQCLRVARVFEDLHVWHGGRFRAPQERTAELSREEIANVRFFTAAQDWKYRQKINPYVVAKEHPEWFDPHHIADDPEESITRMLAAIGVKADQTKKRVDYARNGAEFLLTHYEGSAYNLGPKHGNNASMIREALVAPEDPDFAEHIGYSYKKADMFIRDMYDFGVWPLQMIEALDVPPDTNTMKAALRTGLIRVRHPLLTSYLDVYSYQYTLISELATEAWRRVWERWGDLPNNHRVEGPAFFDFLLYELLGRQCVALASVKSLKCRRCGASSLVRARTRSCPKCGSTDTHVELVRASAEQFKDLLAHGCDFCGAKDRGRCVLEGIISFERWTLAPPRSISRIGGTGWDDGAASDDEGGGGITS